MTSTSRGGAPSGDAGWAGRWAPYSDATYRDALAALQPGQTVLDIGAGDLRFARMACALGCRVVAVERQVEIVRRGLASAPLPDGLAVVIADLRVWPFPPAVDAAVLLMRYCAAYALIVHKLRAAGCPTLITNARWRLGVEVVPLVEAAPYTQDTVGWFACVRCGHTGFAPLAPADLTHEIAERITHVEGCPACTGERV